MNGVLASLAKSVPAVAAVLWAIGAFLGHIRHTDDNFANALRDNTTAINELRTAIHERFPASRG